MGSCYQPWLTFFPTAAGTVASKQSVVLTFEAIASGLGMPITADNGNNLFQIHKIVLLCTTVPFTMTF